MHWHWVSTWTPAYVCHQENSIFSFFDLLTATFVTRKIQYFHFLTADTGPVVKGRVTSNDVLQQERLFMVPDAVQKGYVDITWVTFSFSYFDDSECWMLKCRMFYTTGSKMISNLQVNDVGSYDDPTLNRYANNWKEIFLGIKIQAS